MGGGGDGAVTGIYQRVFLLLGGDWVFDYPWTVGSFARPGGIFSERVWWMGGWMNGVLVGQDRTG